MRVPPVLVYHWFRRADTPSTSRSPQLETTPELFERQLDHLAQSGHSTVSLAEALAGSPGKARSVVITFDDGTLDFWEFARPALERRGFTATVFIVTGYVGTDSRWDGALGEPARPLMSWEQIVALDRAGFEIGSHTHTHRPLTGLADSDALEELTRSRGVLEQVLGRPPRFLAYPRSFFAPRHERMAREAGYEAACAVILRPGDLRRSRRHALQRMPIKGSESMSRFRLRLALARRVPLRG